MITQFLKDYGELISITLIPLIIWFLGIRFQDRKAKQDAKLDLFIKLMANRKSTPNKDFTDSLNLIDIIFQDDAKVRTAWLAYFDSLHSNSQHFQKNNSFLLDLLSEIANSLNYKKLKQTEIDRFYNPQYYGDVEKIQSLLQNEQLRVLHKTKAYGVEMSDSEHQEHLNKIYNKPES